jgi:SAM-dependent methyltransferase
MNYSNITVRDKNPIKRYLQRRRLRDALSPLGALGERFAGRFLDFGAGSGELTKTIADRFPRAKVFCYEPAPDLFEEARQNLAGLDNVVLVSSLEELKGLKFRYVFCLEVFEHLPSRETRRAIRAINRLLSNKGIAVVGIPNELFLPALLKGLFRMGSRYGAYDARFGNVFKAAIGRPPGKRPVREIAPGLPYHFQHTGFDHRKLRRKLSETFEIVRQFGSPVASELLSSEIYLVLKKRNKASGSAGSNPDSTSDYRASELYERPPREPE